MKRPHRIVTCLAMVLGASIFSTHAEDAVESDTDSLVEQKARLLPGPDNVLKFQTDDGRSYQLLRNRLSNALFVDTNLQSKLLLLKGRFPSNGVFEITGNLRSIHNGRTNEVFYYCDICAIQQIDPGPCLCCREPVVLTEKRVP